MDMNEMEAMFCKYCVTCEYRKLEEWKDPCNECLARSSNFNTEKPYYYKEAEKK